MNVSTTLTALAVTLISLTGALAAWASASVQGPASAIIDEPALFGEPAPPGEGVTTGHDTMR